MVVLGCFLRKKKGLSPLGIKERYVGVHRGLKRM
jgi:hypothetical protein